MTITDIGGALARLMGTSEQELLDSLKNPDNAEEFRSKEEIEQILNDGFSAKFQEVIKQQQGRAKRETLSGLEKELKQKFEIDTTKQGIDLIEEIVNSRAAAAAKAASEKEISEGEVKNHPIFQSAITTLQKEKEAVLQEFTGFKQSIEQQRKQAKVHNVLKSELMKLNPILPEGKEQFALDAWLKMFDVNQFQIEGEKLKLVDSEGNPMLDEKYNPVGITDLVVRNNIFNTHKKDPTKSSPSPAPNSKSVVVDNVEIASLNDFAKVMADQTGKYSREFKEKLKQDFLNKKE